MDYVLFGMGYGATLMLLGWALRTFGPERKYKDVNPEDIDRTMLQRRWVRFIQGLGGVIAIAGTAFVLFTFVIMLVNPDDETGAFISLVIWGFLALAVLIWCWFYVASFGTTGVWSREDGYRSAGPIRNIGARNSRSTISKTAPVRNDEPVEPITSEEPLELEGPAMAVGYDVDDDKAEASTDETSEEDSGEPERNAEANLEAEPEESDPEYDFGDGTDTTVPSDFGGRSEAIQRLRERQARSGNSSN